jgi:hypothetical protein
MPFCLSDWSFRHGVTAHCRIDFNLQFTFLVLTLISNALVLFVGLLRCYSIAGQEFQGRDLTSKSFRFKLALATATAVTSLLSLAGWITCTHGHEELRSSVALAGVAVNFVVAALLPVWLFVEQARALQSSGLVFLSHLLLFGCRAVCIRTFSLVGFRSLAPLFYGGFITTFCLGTVSLVAEVALLDASPRSPGARSILDDVFLVSQWKLLLKGYSHSFALHDLPREMESSAVLYARFKEVSKIQGVVVFG